MKCIQNYKILKGKYFERKLIMAFFILLEENVTESDNVRMFLY